MPDHRGERACTACEVMRPRSRAGLDSDDEEGRERESEKDGEVSLLIGEQRVLPTPMCAVAFIGR